MRVIPTSLGLDNGVMSHALLTRLTRRDGQVTRFTSHDRDINLQQGLQSEVFPARNRVVVTNIETSEGTEVGNLTLQGYLRSDELTEGELRAGLYDGADLRFLLVTWEANPLGEHLVLPRFTLGQVRWGRLTFEVELAGLTDRLQQVIGELTSPGCRVRVLFDHRCNPPGNTTPTSNPAQFRHVMNLLEIRTPSLLVFGPWNPATVAQAMNPAQTGSEAHWATYFQGGTLRWQSGNNDGLAMEIKNYVAEPGAAVVTLQLPMPFALTVGNTAELEAGCNRTLAICKGRFSNVINLQSEPHLPGTDSVLQIVRR